MNPPDHPGGRPTDRASAGQAGQAAWEAVFSAAGLAVFFIFFIALVPVTSDYLNPELKLTAEYSSGSLLRQVQLVALFLLALWMLRRNQDTVSSVVARINPALLLVLLYCLVTALWSPLPVVTLKRVVIFGGLIMVGAAVAPPIGKPHGMTRAFLLTVTMICLVSVLVALLIPSIGTQPEHGGAWRGITRHKNTLGATACYAVLLWLYEWTRGELRRSTCVAGLGLSLLVLLMARSSTAVLLAFAGCAAYLYWHRHWVRERGFGMLLVLWGIPLALLAVHFHFVVTGAWPTWGSVVGPIAAIFEKSSDLTGRTTIWELVLLSIRNHLAFGGGYGAFWLGAGSPSQYIIDALRWIPTQSHNGYLDVVNELGLFGLSLFLILLGWHLRCIVRLLAYDRPEAALHLAFLVILLISNITETDFLSDTTLQNILFVLSSTTVTARLGLFERRMSGPRTETSHAD